MRIFFLVGRSLRLALIVRTRLMGGGWRGWVTTRRMFLRTQTVASTRPCAEQRSRLQFYFTFLPCLFALVLSMNYRGVGCEGYFHVSLSLLPNSTHCSFIYFLSKRR